MRPNKKYYDKKFSKINKRRSDKLSENESEIINNSKNDEQITLTDYMIDRHELTVREFCLRHTKAIELVVICDPYIRHTVWIDHEDIFIIHPDYANKIINKHKWGKLPIVTEHGDKLEIPCHVIDVN